MKKVTNTGHNPIEAAGQVFRPGRTVDVKLTDQQAAAVRRNRRLKVQTPARPAAAAAKPEADGS